MVAYYGNYTMIVAKVGQVFSSILDSTYAGVGNLVAEGNKHNMMKVFWELMTIRHFVAGFLCFSIYHFIEPFISIWLGPEYILNHKILILLILFIYITNSRGSVDAFNYAHGLYADVWSAWAELIINVTVTIVCGLKWGIIGILLGKISSLVPIVVFWKPYYLFSAGFKEPVGTYWRGVLRNYAVTAFSIACSLYVIQFVPVNPYNSLWEWIGYAAVCMTVLLTTDITTTLLFAKGAKDSLNRIKIIRKR
jgi:O-antigen/teichoic acid export membrane protein